MTVAGGTLNLMSHSIGNSITLITTGGELENITTIQTTGGVTMNTSGNTLTSTEPMRGQAHHDQRRHGSSRPGE